MADIKIRNQSYTYQVHRSRENVPFLLMLHGFMGSARAFTHLLERLSKFCNPITVDLLGHGSSSHESDPERFLEEEQVEDLLELTDRLNLFPLFLHGYSMGGRLALKTALASPGQFKGLILESSTCGLPGDERRKRRISDEGRARLIEEDYLQFLEKWEEAELFEAPEDNGSSSLLKLYHEIHRQQEPACMAASLRGFGTGRMKSACDQLENFYHPVLLITGSEDKKYQKINTRMGRKFPEARLKVLKAGHRVHLDNPAAFINELKSFIQ